MSNNDEPHSELETANKPLSPNNNSALDNSSHQLNLSDTQSAHTVSVLKAEIQGWKYKAAIAALSTLIPIVGCLFWYIIISFEKRVEEIKKRNESTDIIIIEHSKSIVALKTKLDSEIRRIDERASNFNKPRINTKSRQRGLSRLLTSAKDALKGGDKDLALSFYGFGCDLLNAESCFQAAKLEEQNREQPARSIYYYLRGCYLRSHLACNNLGWIYHLNKKKPSALHYWKLGAEFGNVSSELALANSMAQKPSAHAGAMVKWRAVCKKNPESACRNRRTCYRLVALGCQNVWRSMKFISPGKQHYFKRMCRLFSSNCKKFKRFCNEYGEHCRK